MTKGKGCTFLERKSPNVLSWLLMSHKSGWILDMGFPWLIYNVHLGINFSIWTHWEYILSNSWKLIPMPRYFFWDITEGFLYNSKIDIQILCSTLHMAGNYRWCSQKPAKRPSVHYLPVLSSSPWNPYPYNQPPALTPRPAWTFGVCQPFLLIFKVLIMDRLTILP